MYAKLNGSNSVPPSPPSDREPTVLLNNFLTFIISSGKIYDLAEVVRDLNKGDDLMIDQSYSERQLFEKAYDRLLSEFQIIMNSNLEITQKKIDIALKRNLEKQIQKVQEADSNQNLAETGTAQ